MCKTLGVSSSGYYAWQGRPRSRRAEVDQVLQRRIEAIHAQSRGNYGSPKIHAQLQQEGLSCSRKRVIRLMRQVNICAKRQRCYKRTTRRDGTHAVAKNRLQQNFVATQPDQVWLADITFVPTAEGWLYLAAVMDLFSRRILGWAMDVRMTDTLTQRALTMALARRHKRREALIHHSDRGSQYTSARYQMLLTHHQIQVSMSGVGNCYDNAPMESFFSLLKTEVVHHERYATRQAAKTSLFDYIEAFYNRQRIHSSTDYLSPAAYEARWLHSFSWKGKDTISLLNTHAMS